MRQPNFDQCGRAYMGNQTAQDLYGWGGPTIGIRHNRTSQITTEGCKVLCGADADYYPWALSSATITTWILPVVGVLLQAPFESNAFVRTTFALARWVGSPMASIAYILWNIKVSAKCALMVDMAARCDEPIPDREKSDFGSIRDSFYILTTMNQYKMKRSEAKNKEAEGLLRMVLFSKDLRLCDKKGKERNLNEMRQRLAQKLRAARKRGTVPVFISTMWFIFSLAISIQASFTEIGLNATAHDLALGLLLAWLPVLILCSIVDRNPVAADDIRRKLNKLVETVCAALQDENIRNEFIDTFEGRPEAKRLEEWVWRISERSEHMRNFFVSFAGQGRLRWHYGAAHPILSDIENSYVAAHGRGWLANEAEARMHLVLGSVDEGLLWFDVREFHQILSAVVIVAGTCLGAFFMSFYTPTVGLGCRSGGYVIFVIIAFAQLVLELLVWWIASPARPAQPHWLQRGFTHLQSQPTFNNAQGMAQRGKMRLLNLRNTAENAFVNASDRLLHMVPGNSRFKGKMKSSVRHQVESCHSWTFQRWTEICVFRPLEVCNSIWLMYIVMAQTFGSYRTCECMTATWSSTGGYMDFQQWNHTDSPLLQWYWSAGTAVGTSIMGLGLIYVITEWCLQSHVSTEDYAAATRGLRRTRRYRLFTYPMRLLTRTAVNACFNVGQLILTVLRIGCKTQQQQTLLWKPDPPKRTDKRRSAVSASRYFSDYDGHGNNGTLPRVGPLGATPGGTPMIHLEQRGGVAQSQDRRNRSASLDPVLSGDLGADFAIASQPSSPPYVPGSRTLFSRSRGGSESSRAPLVSYPDAAHTRSGSDDWASAKTGALDTATQRSSSDSPTGGYEALSLVESPPPSRPVAAARGRGSEELLLQVGAGFGARPGYARRETDDERRGEGGPASEGLGIAFREAGSLEGGRLGRGR